MAPSGSLVSPERRLHVAEQRARRKLLHDQLETIWDENKRFNLIYVAEDRWEQAVNATVWFPKLTHKQNWDLAILLLILYSCVVVPFRIGMSADAEGYVWLFEVFVTLMFITDIFFNFNTAYLEGTNYVIDRTMIAKNYVKSWFVIDALSSFPVELVDLFTASAQAAAAAAGEETDNTLVKGLRALRMVRLLRMMKLLKMQQYIDDLEDRSGMNMQILQIFKMVCLMLYLMHLLGCFWFYVATNSGYESSWVTEYDGGSAVDAPTDVQYLYAVYWALTTLTTVGYGDITPVNNAERVYTLCCLLIGALVFGYILSSVGDMMSNVDKNAVALDSKLDEVKAFTRWHKMHPDLAARVRRYGETFYTRQSAMDEDTIISNLAPALKREVVRHLLRKTAARIPMFSEEYCEYASLDGFQLEVHPYLKPVVYELGETVIAKTSPGDGLYFLDKGTIGAFGSIDSRTLFQITDTGSCFGEHAVINRTAEISYRAVTRCEFYVLDKRDLYKVLNKFPDARKEMAEFIFEDLLRHMMLRYWAFHTVTSDVKEHDKRVAAALQLQVSWMRRNILKLQREHANDEQMIMDLMPGIFGIDDASTPESARGSARFSPREASMSSPKMPTPSFASSPQWPPAAVDLSAVQSALGSLDAERAKLEKKDASIERQITALQKAVEKLVGELQGS